MLVVCCSCRSLHVPQNSCSVVTVPETWLIMNMAVSNPKPEITTTADEADDFELRAVGKNVDIAVRSGRGILQNVYSNNKFRFLPELGTSLSHITDEEWQNGKSDIVPIRSPQSGEIEPTSGSEVSYRGKRFHFSGQHFGDAQPSPTGAWLSLQSFDGDYDPKDSLIPNHGTFHVDVFSTRRGTKQFSVSANVDHQEPGTPARGIRWIGDSYLFLDLFPDEQKFLLCDATKRTN